MSKKLGWQTSIHPDIGWVFRLNPSESDEGSARKIYWVDVEVYDIYGYAGAEGSLEPSDYSLKPRGWTGNEESVSLDDLSDDNCEWVAKGYVKWDGCSNMEFNNCVHICGMSDAKNFSAMIVRLWEHCQKLCASSDENFG
jgi:hypothetical protein